MMLDLAEVLRSHAKQRRAIDLAVPADVVVDTWVERPSVLVLPGFLGLVFVVDEDGFGTPVVLLPRQIAATFEQEDFLA